MTAHDNQLGDAPRLFRGEVADARRLRLEGAIVLSAPVRSSLVAALLLALALALAAWAVLGTYTRSEVARGILVTDVPAARIVAARAGEVAELAVRDGDRVAAGQRLATIRVAQPDETGAPPGAAGLAALDAQRALAERQAELALDRASAERARLGAALDGARRQRSDLAAQLALQEQAAASARQLFETIGPVMQRGFISRVEYERRRQAMLAAEQQLAQLRQQAGALAAQERQAAAELMRVDAEAGTDLADARSAAQALAERRAQALASRAYTLTAPIAGRVTALQASPGKAVDPSAPLLAIVPERAPLHAELYAPTRAIGFVAAGQRVRLLYDAFPYQRFGSFSGRVTRVSRTALDPREVAAPLKLEEPVYRIEVALERQRVDAFGQALALQPGMTLSANLILDRRSFLDWLLQPLNAVSRRT